MTERRLIRGKHNQWKTLKYILGLKQNIPPLDIFHSQL